jgi:TPR repeat protein
MLLNGECLLLDYVFQARIFCHPNFRKPNPSLVRGADPSEIEGIEDRVLIAKWFQKFAHQGDTYTQLVYGMFYYFGYGVPQDFTKSAEWFKLAADGRETYAQILSGIQLLKGEGVQANFPESFKFFQLAAKQGNPIAQNCTAERGSQSLGLSVHLRFSPPHFPVPSTPFSSDLSYLRVQGSDDLGYRARALPDRDFHPADKTPAIAHKNPN